VRERGKKADRTMLSSFNSLSRLISRIAVLGTPSSSASSLIFFSATICPELISFALYTTPYVPTKDRWINDSNDCKIMMTDLPLHIVRSRWVVIRPPKQQRSHTNFLNFLISTPVFLLVSSSASGRWRIAYRSILNYETLVVGGRNKKSVYRQDQCGNQACLKPP
jgi:hypothetical protein